MSDRIDLLLAILTTICGAVSITVTTLGWHLAMTAYVWSLVAVAWCWLWYADTLRGGGRS